MNQAALAADSLLTNYEYDSSNELKLWGDEYVKLYGRPDDASWITDFDEFDDGEAEHWEEEMEEMRKQGAPRSISKARRSAAMACGCSRRV